MDRFLLFLCWLPWPVLAWINYPSSGYASMTHYDLPRDYIASCGCTAASTHYPTTALSQMAFGSSTAFGPSCGRCFKLTLINTFLSDPPYYPTTQRSLVVKVTDLCPLSQDGWCSGTENKTNPAGHQLNFDLAFPSEAIPVDFFPSNASLYGYTDFGVWNISYESVSCSAYWAGGSDKSALGSALGLDSESACCPADPMGNPNNTCPSYSDHNGIAPDTTTTGAGTSVKLSNMSTLLLPVLLTLIPIFIIF